VNIRSVILKLHEVCIESREKSGESKRKWAERFIAWHGFSIRRITRCVLISDEVLLQRRNEFFDQIWEAFARDQSMVFLNMDQTCVNFGDVGSTTIDIIGARSVQVQQQGTQSDRVTAALTVASNGDKLIPFVIYKGTVDERVSREFRRSTDPYPALAYFTNERSWMIESAMHAWIDNVLLPYTRDHPNVTTCLILDSFQVHMMSSVRAKFTEHGITVVYIPGGLTADLQPLDVGINSPFKHWLREFLINHHEFSRMNVSLKRLSIAKGIERAWEKITHSTVIGSFGRVLSVTLAEIVDANEIK
jgi:hypothetical protein